MRIDEQRIKAVEKVLKEPVAAEFSEQAWKIRTNLIVAASIALVMGLAKIQIAPDSTFLGLKFTGLNDTLIRFTLATVVVYLLVHFMWAGWDAFLEWRLRITGTRTLFQTGAFFGPEHVDYPVEPRQSTLYNWWSMQQATIGEIGKQAVAIQDSMRKWEADIQRIREGKDDPYSSNLNAVVHGLSQAQASAAKLAHIIEQNTKAMTDDRIPASLKRFDGWFQLFLRSQNLRWFVIEFLAPVAFSLTALYALLK